MIEDNIDIQLMKSMDIPKSYLVIALIGPSGCGKDTLLKEVCAAAPDIMHPIVHVTTRPKRSYEVEGKDYHFVTDGEFLEKLLANEMVECAEFNHWFYGTLEQDLSTEGINIGTFTPIALEALATHPNIAIKLFYIDVPDRVRLLRQLSRDEDVDVNEVVRRYKTDQEDFADISDFIYTTLPNETEEDKKLNVVKIVDAAHKMLLGNLN